MILFLKLGWSCGRLSGISVRATCGGQVLNYRVYRNLYLLSHSGNL